VFFFSTAAHSQSQDLPKFEVAGEFTMLQRDDLNEGKKITAGFGGRFTYNLNRVFSLEAAGHFFPKDCFDCLNPGELKQAVGGIKVGKRFERWGVFAKARPGAVHHSDDFGGSVICLNILCPFPTEPFVPNRTHFAFDVGGVIEFYPSKRIVTRFDAGDAIIHFGRRVTEGLVFNPSRRQLEPFHFIELGRTSHNFQFITSVGFRF
jgi:hypothetical protein